MILGFVFVAAISLGAAHVVQSFASGVWIVPAFWGALCIIGLLDALYIRLTHPYYRNQ